MFNKGTLWLSFCISVLYFVVMILICFFLALVLHHSFAVVFVISFCILYFLLRAAIRINWYGQNQDIRHIKVIALFKADYTHSSILALWSLLEGKTKCQCPGIQVSLLVHFWCSEESTGYFQLFLLFIFNCVYCW